MRQTAIQFESQGMAIEGVLATPEPRGADPAIVLACHPHPMLGGDMDNAVITAICAAAARHGIASLRFNFRGVKGSAGEFTNGPGEGHDLAAAARAMRRWPGLAGRRMAVAGYSFGAGVAVREIGRIGTVRGLALVAPPVSATEALRKAKRGTSVLCVAGSRDGVSPPDELRRRMAETLPGAGFAEVAGADHSFAGREREVGDLVAEFLAGALD